MSQYLAEQSSVLSSYDEPLLPKRRIDDSMAMLLTSSTTSAPSFGLAGLLRDMQGNWVNADGQLVNVTFDEVKFYSSDGTPLLPSRVLQVNNDQTITLLGVRAESVTEEGIVWSDNDLWKSKVDRPRARTIFRSTEAHSDSNASSSSIREILESPRSRLTDRLDTSPQIMPKSTTHKLLSFFCCCGSNFFSFKHSHLHRHDQENVIRDAANAVTITKIESVLLQKTDFMKQEMLKEASKHSHISESEARKILLTDEQKHKLLGVVLTALERSVNPSIEFCLILLKGAVSRGSDLSEFKKIVEKLCNGRDMERIQAGREDGTEANMIRIWWAVDKNGDGELNLQEVKRLMGKLNINISLRELRKLMKTFDVNNDRVLNYPEFTAFHSFLERKQEDVLVKVVNLLEKSRGKTPSEKFCNFVAEHQDGDTFTKEQIEDIIESGDGSFTRKFVKYLISSKNSWVDSPSATAKDDMTLPLPEYLIYGSHNTYLSGGQIATEISRDMYKVALLQGVRCIEIDTWDGNNGQPCVTHALKNIAFAPRIPFSHVVETISEAAFRTSPYPLIVSLENHCSETAQEIMAAMMQSHLKNSILPRSEAAQLRKEQFTPHGLRYRILIRCRRCTGALKELVALSPKEFNPQVVYPDMLQCPSIDEELAKKHGRHHNILKATQGQVVRVYPAGKRQDSSNFNPATMWAAGMQICAMNIQTPDFGQRLNVQKFEEKHSDGSPVVGYVLKPPSARCMVSQLRCVLRITVLCGGGLPKPSGGDTGDILDPYVQLILSGTEADSRTLETTHVEDNGFSPMWYQEKVFLLSSPESAILTVRVKDSETVTSDKLVGEASCSVQYLRQGYRSVNLKSEGNKPLHDSFVILHIKKEL